MKNLILGLTSMLFVFSCTQKAKETHSEKHTSGIHFDVSNSSNISHFNVYLNEDLVGQISSSGMEKVSTYSFDNDNEFPAQPYKLNYEVEPIFLDSASALTDISMKIEINQAQIAESANTVLKYGEFASLVYSAK